MAQGAMDHTHRNYLYALLFLHFAILALALLHFLTCTLTLILTITLIRTRRQTTLDGSHLHTRAAWTASSVKWRCMHWARACRSSLIARDSWMAYSGTPFPTQSPAASPGR